MGFSNCVCKGVDTDLGNSLREDSAGNWRAMGEFMAGFMGKRGDGETQRHSAAVEVLQGVCRCWL